MHLIMQQHYLKDDDMTNELRPILRAQSFVEKKEYLARETCIPRNRSLSDLQVRGAVFRRGPLEYNGCGDFLGTTPCRSTKKDNVRCGNCGEYDHITIDCVLLGDDDADDQPSLSYLQKELHRTHIMRECQHDAEWASPLGRKIIPTTIPERMTLQ
ncbi:hypothetical protein H257_05565 [Aphanomyces astaci]|uniref:Uncharacterized protein n=1 Tax=Aphanomyces astaci TaxID=112090 RepID=W4GRV6_APHAT|nr:hypothetical protein H257_05565 [Aphanomyces astaci]ETV82046.1 hypothetical protein H257_05565 [Aphanomyces astaci]KAF0703152.1 hypothetical protein AaE_015520 [Aphanomyces astaci]RHY00017.1 hypothetical protein DYB36_014099 [Aphanomyces astaci]RHY02735.1 hypothetical protein DYB25_004566 [Aphanomyces astaci]RHY54508.1 hypothetical protein DYB34_002651 [Aphanomyces astaci]|eukprot:XP_009828783.1 hypothetical protein H257_05565 [Aphanomyces astaci]